MASSNAAALVASAELRVLEFEHFGTAFMKRHRLLPDAFMQMAIQLAWAKLHGTPVSTYETAHTRLFYHGRTETIRSCSEESVAFCRAMTTATVSDKERVDALRAALDAHKDFTRAALTGEGVDRHLMGLYILARMSGMDPLPALFTDKGFLRSKEWTLSTSNISLSSSPMFGGFSSVSTNGYGVCYTLREGSLKASIAACTKSTNGTSALRFRDALASALVDMQRACATRSILYVADAVPSKPAAAAAPAASESKL
jgi:carnitine O-acetyltransferase